MALSVVAATFRTTTGTITAPTGISAGDIMVMTGHAYGAVGSTDCDITTSSHGWSLVSSQLHTFQRTVGSMRDLRTKLWAKVATGTETSLSVSLTGVSGGGFQGGAMYWVVFTGNPAGSKPLGFFNDAGYIDGVTNISSPYVPATLSPKGPPVSDIAFLSTANSSPSAVTGWTRFPTGSAEMNDVMGGATLWYRDRTGTYTSPSFATTTNVAHYAAFSVGRIGGFRYGIGFDASPGFNVG